MWRSCGSVFNWQRWSCLDSSLQKDARTRNVHASTAIEGNPLTLEKCAHWGKAGRDNFR